MKDRPHVTIEQDCRPIATGRLELPDTIIHSGLETLALPLSVAFEDGCRFEVIELIRSVHPPHSTALILPPGSADVADPDPGPFWDDDDPRSQAHKPLWCWWMPRLPYC